ncbi:MAG TPA: SDR family NAD(P)-dependent oxidoreductase [Bryobacteraceae bacterium]|nr:SDR family NAD(P)-dependent oxidoreductase [Bryobacteraceae bacterium]
MKFAGKVALVAGGTGGLGRAVSLAFLREGAELIVTYRDDREFAALKTESGANASRLTGRRVDVTDEAAVEQLIQGIGVENKTLDILVNSVGGYAGGIKLWELDTKILDQMLTLNLRSGFLLSRAAAKAMLRRGKGVIVNVASKAALDHEAGVAAYAASKAAAVAMMNSLAADLKGTGVRVNSVLPSIIDTERNRKAMPGADFAKWPKPEDIARVILFLCSDDAKVVHGAAIPVYGDS